VIGARRPRVETHPDYAYSYGPEAAELMARAGRPLDPWQLDAVTLMLAVREDGQWACYECCEWVSRQNGKGAILEARALAGFFLLAEELIMWSAHEYKTAMEAFRRVKAIIRALGVQVDIAGNLFDVDGILVKVNNTNGEECFERLDSGARIKFVARSKGSGRGFSADCNIIDEAFAYTAEQQSALLYTLSARPNPQIIYTSSPPLTGDTGEIMYDLRLRGDPTAPRSATDPSWTQDPSLSYRDWGMAGVMEMLDGVDLDDVANWAATNPALGIRITHETIARQRRATAGMPADFARERLGIWPKRAAAGAGVIPGELWRDLAVIAERPADVAMAIVVNHKRSHTAIAAVGMREDGRMQVSIVDYRPGTHWVVDRAVELNARWTPVGWAVQDKGPSATLIEPLEAAGIVQPEDRDEPRRGQLAVPWSNDVAVAYGLLIDAVTERRFVHLDEAPLNLAVATGQTRPLGGGTTWDYRAPGAELLQAGTLAHWLYVAWVDKVSNDYDVLQSVF
jgi:hypothetical protein